MRFLKPLTIAMPAALVVLSVAGCGGGGSDSTDSTTAATTETTAALSKAELISQGDAICAEVNAAVGSVGTSEAAVPRQVTQVSDLYIGMVDSIKRLGMPGEPAGYSEFIEAAEELSAVESEAKLAAEREDSAALGEAATKAGPALEEFEAQAGAYGFEDCSEGPSAPTPSGTGAAPSEEEGGVEVAPEVSEEPEVEEAAPEEVAPETGGAGGGVEEAAPEGGGTGGGTSGGGSGGVGPG
jgi:hypothetical protein